MGNLKSNKTKEEWDDLVDSINKQPNQITMENEFVPYEQALALKELGFDKPCFGYYSGTGNYIGEEGKMNSNCNKLGMHSVYCTAPLYQQAFRWFREKCKLIGLVEGGYDNGKNIFTYVIWDDFKDNSVDIYYQTYEEAELDCLIKLIEIVKSK
jgi:hypothetical protein